MKPLFDRITRLSIRFWWITIGAAAVLMALGIYAVSQLKIELLPSIDFPSTYILARSNGATGSDIMLHAYTIPLEERTQKVEGVENIESNTTDSLVFMEIRNSFGLDQRQLREELRRTLDELPLPVRTLRPPEGQTAADLIAELSPEAFLYLYVYSLNDSQRGGFLPQLSPRVWEQLSPAVLNALPDEAFDTLDSDLAAQLRARRTGTPLPLPDLAEVEPPALPASWREDQPDLDRFETVQDLIELTGIRNLAGIFNDLLADGSLTGPLGTVSDLTEADIELLRSYEAACRANTGVDQQAGCTLLSNDLLANEDAPLPDTLRFEKPSLITFSISDIPLAVLSASADEAQITHDELRQLVEDNIVPRLEALDSVADVAVRGGEEIPPEVIAAAANGNGSNPAAAANASYEPPVGEDGTRIHDPDAPSLEGWGMIAAFVGAEELDTADDLFYTQSGGQPQAPSAFLNRFVGSEGEAYIRALPADVFLYLADCTGDKLCEEDFFAHLSDSFLGLISDEAAQALPEDVQTRRAAALTEYRPADFVTRTNLDNSLILEIRKENGANTVTAWAEVEEVLAEIQAGHPDIRFEVAFEQASYIEESINGVAREGGLGAVMAVVVILIFLNFSLRSTLVTAVSIPTSVALAFVLMKWLPGNVHDWLAPAAENASGLLHGFLTFILRLFPDDVSLNIMTLSGLTVAVGRVVDDAIVVLENIYRNVQRGEDRLEAILHGTRDVSLAIFAATVTTVVVFLPIGLFGGVIGAFFLPFGLAVTYALLSSFVVAITLVPLLAYFFLTKRALPAQEHTRLERTYRGVIRWALTHRWAVIALATLAFVAGVVLLAQLPTAFLPSFGEPTITINVELPREIDGRPTTIAVTDAKVRELETYLDGSLGGVKTIQTSVGGGGQFLDGGSVSENVATITVSVESQDVLDRLTPQVRREAERIFGPDHVTVSGASLSEQGFGGFAVVISGDDPANPPTLDELRRVDALVIETLEGIEGITNVESSLSRLGGSSNSYIRIDGVPAARYTAELETDDTLGLTQRAIETLRRLDLPDNLTVSEGFESQQQTEGFQQTFVSMGIAVVIVYFVMVLTFGSFLHPITILFSLPLATVGAAVGLAVTGRVLGLSAVVGLLMLVGIVVTNAIVLIDRVQTNRRQRHMDVSEALTEGGATRLRPILMTAIATMVALLPLAIGLSEGAIVAAELGTVVIGGLFSSTLLTLVVVPVVYSLFDQGLGAVGRRLFRRR